MCRVGPRGQWFAYKGSEKKFNNSYSYVAECIGRTKLLNGLRIVQPPPISSRLLPIWKIFRALKTQKRNFNPTKYKPLCTRNGTFRTHRTSASVGVLALVTGVGT